ncbi:MAG: HAD family phosphatase [Ruminococcus sp.]|nr:HAD family phosphatase [Ruminococcus sp.]
MPLNFKGAVFDMDGLMLDSEKVVYQSWQTVMDEAGYPYSLDIFKRTVGLRVDSTEQLYKSIYGADFDYVPFRLKAREMFYNYISENGVPVKKGLFEILEFLKENGIKTAVATSTSSQTAMKVIRMSGVYDFFDEFVCGDFVKNSKPHPEIFLTAAEKILLKPEECIAFEDSINGIKAAFAAGMKPIMIPDYLQPTEEIKPMLSLLCNDLSEAVKELEKL